MKEKLKVIKNWEFTKSFLLSNFAFTKSFFAQQFRIH